MAIIATDDFSRTENPLSDGGAWITPDYFSALKATGSDAVAASTAASGCVAVRSGGTYANDQYSEVVKTNSTSSSIGYIGCVVRHTTGYFYVFFYKTSGGTHYFNKWHPLNGLTTVGTYMILSALTTGSKVRLTIVGNTLDLLVDGVSVTSGVGRTDSSDPYTTGRPGCASAYTSSGSGAATITSWEGGDFTTAGNSRYYGSQQL